MARDLLRRTWDAGCDWLGCASEHWTCNTHEQVLAVGAQGSRVEWKPRIEPVIEGRLSLTIVLLCGDLHRASSAECIVSQPSSRAGSRASSSPGRINWAKPPGMRRR